MFRPRLIPCLLIQDGGLVKTVRFDKSSYIGDPINAVKIFNNKQADELMILDIGLSRNGGVFHKRKTAGINWDIIKKISGECLMPLSYGGGITSTIEMEKLFNLGIEKVVINSAAIDNPILLSDASKEFGSQSLIVSIDVRVDNKNRHIVYTHGGTKKNTIDPIDIAIDMETRGAGEILVNSINNDGMMAGYDINLLRRFSDVINIPIIACGGAGTMDDFREGFQNGGASALAAGSFFVYHGSNKAVLISYPTQKEIEQLFLSIN